MQTLVNQTKKDSKNLFVEVHQMKSPMLEFVSCLVLQVSLVFCPWMLLQEHQEQK